MEAQNIRDNEWYRKSFMVPFKQMSNREVFNRELRSAEEKFTDTTLGGNIAINPPPQFCRNADLKVKGKFSASQGMGRYYSEALDDRGQFVHMRMGVPQYNSMIGFLKGFYNISLGDLANYGRAESSLYEIGQVAGYVISAPLQPILWFREFVNFIASKPNTRFYNVKPTMPLYWNAVSTIVNSIGVNMGLIGRQVQEAEEKTKGKMDPSAPLAGENKAIYDSMAGEFFGGAMLENGGLDVYKMATRAARLANKNRNRIADLHESASNWDQLVAKLQDALFDNYSKADAEPKKNLENYIASYHGLTVAKPSEGEKNHEKSDLDGYKDGFGDFLEAELADGAAFITLRVDSTGESSESFSNSVGESSIASRLNSSISDKRNLKFDTAGFNISDDMFTDAIEGFASGVKNLIKGGLDSVGLGGLAGLAGGGYVDIPQVYQNSSADLPRMSYTMELRSPYGNDMARFQNLYVPLAMVLAAGLPLSTGPQSYTSPFLVELYSQGRAQTRLGMIDSIEVTRGVGNMGWNNRNQALGIDVSFSIVDLSNVVHMPITSGFGPIESSTGGVFSKDIFADDTAFNDYMALLGGLSMMDQIYPVNKLRLRSALRRAAWAQMQSPAYHANWIAGTGVGQLASGILGAIIKYDTPAQGL